MDEFRVYAKEISVNFLFVDDGSTDDTLSVLRAACKESRSLDVVGMASNVGKGEAVRFGMLHVLNHCRTDLVGYWDADLATPLNEIGRFLRRFAQEESIAAVFGARVQLLGRRVCRSATRHYLGRIYATIASWALDLPVYDTQCGAKMFRCIPSLRDSLEGRFESRWAFDVELMARLLDRGVDPSCLFEIPLESWTDIPGSKLGLLESLVAGLRLIRFGFRRRCLGKRTLICDR